MHPATVSQLKRTLRLGHLRRLRAWARAEPSELRTASQQVCDHLYTYIQSRYATLSHSTLGCASAETKSSQRHATTPTTTIASAPLFIFAYLPLYYELDLVPLMRRLWPTAQAQNIHLLTPVVLTSSCSSCSPPSSAAARSKPTSCATDTDSTMADLHKSAMVFVEVFDEEDLHNAFAPQGRFQIREFSRALLEPWLTGHEGDTSTELPSGSEGEPHTDAEKEKSAAATVCHEKDGRVRHLVLCDEYARLFPAAHAAGYRPAGLLEYASKGSLLSCDGGASPAFSPPLFPGNNSGSNTRQGSTGGELQTLDDVNMLVLAPGVLFDVQTGRRVGKGCGYYDRFLAYHARHHSSTLPSGQTREAEESNTHSASTDNHADWEVMAVAFDSQVLNSAASLPDTPVQESVPEQIPIDAHDQPMHSVVSPSGGVERVPHSAA